MHAIRSLEVHDLTGTQTYVLSCLSRSSTDFLPVELCADTCFDDVHTPGAAQPEDMVNEMRELRQEIALHKQVLEGTKQALMLNTRRLNEIDLRINEPAESENKSVDHGPAADVYESDGATAEGSLEESSVDGGLIVITPGADGEGNDDNNI